MLARFTATRRLPSVISVSKRFVNDGSVGSSKEFSEKERAHETEYVRRHEAEKLAKLKEEIAKQQAELKELQESVDKKDAKAKSS